MPTEGLEGGLGYLISLSGAGPAPLLLSYVSSEFIMNFYKL